MLKNKLIDDVTLRVNQGDITDDTTIEPTQIAYWANQVLPQLIKSEVDAELKAGRSVPPIYITREDCEPLAIEDLDCVSDCEDGIYFDLNADIIDLQNDGGLVRMITDEGDEVKVISLGVINSLRNMRFAKPSMTNPVAYRVGARRIYVEGFSHSEVPFDFITTYYVKRQDIEALADSGEILISSALAPILMDTLVEILKQQLYGSTPDTANDGVDVKQSVYHRTISQNSPNVQPPQ